MPFLIIQCTTARPLDPSQLTRIQQKINESEFVKQAVTQTEETSFFGKISKILMSFIKVKEYDPSRQVQGVRYIMSNGRIHLIPVDSLKTSKKPD